jgi:uncharacterized protein RhaS with RHS repeats
MGIEGGENLYVYVTNNPVNYVDPWGLIVAGSVGSSRSYQGPIGGWTPINGTVFGAASDYAVGQAGVGGLGGPVISGAIQAAAGQGGVTENDPAGNIFGLGLGIAAYGAGVDGPAGYVLSAIGAEFSNAVSPGLANFGRDLALLEIALNQQLQQTQTTCKGKVQP